MLVLSRKVGEKVLLPDIAAAVKVVGVKGEVVRLGFEAPPRVTVLREELAGQERDQTPAKKPADPRRELIHALRNRLNAATIGLALFRKQRELGMATESDATLERLTREVEAMQSDLDAETRPPAAAATPSRKRKALLVEDDTNERELLAGFLRLAGMEVMTAGDGLDALQSLRSGPAPDVVLLDMGLPRCDGPATVREIRRDPAMADLKVFAVSGRSPDEFGDEGVRGVSRWLRKPVNPERLLQELERELEQVA